MILDSAACRTETGDWTRQHRERYTVEENGLIDQMNEICDANIALDHLPENHRIHYLAGMKFDL